MHQPQQTIYPAQTPRMTCHDSGLSINDVPPTQLDHLPNQPQSIYRPTCPTLHRVTLTNMQLATLMSQMVSLTTYQLSESNDPIVPPTKSIRILHTCCPFISAAIVAPSNVTLPVLSMHYL